LIHKQAEEDKRLRTFISGGIIPKNKLLLLYKITEHYIWILTPTLADRFKNTLSTLLTYMQYYEWNSILTAIVLQSMCSVSGQDSIQP
jgi:hypothetical protein